MSTAFATIDLPKEIVQALDDLAQTMSLSREETLRIAVTRARETEREFQELRKELQVAAKRKGIETEEDLYAFLESDED